ncbi:MAG TPA: ABC transporter permease [Alphaproteobacteria bacterium]|nr:ABC transporter permease [Alphaproteobacteria bacterium]
MLQPSPPLDASPNLAVRRFGAVNWVGLASLCNKEIRRFAKVYMQTMIAPIVITLLFLAIFTLAVGNGARVMGAVPFPQFLAPGLIMMAIVQNAFANTSSSITISKLQGNIVDVLMPPLSPGELTFGFVAGGVVRGLLVALVVGLGVSLFAPVHIHDWRFVLFHALAAATLLSLLGTAGGIWADKFDHIAAVTNFVIMPLSFLSGTFYSIDRLPPLFKTLAHLDPFFYMIDGFRYGFIGASDGSRVAGILVLVGANAGLWALCHWMFKTGYKLKA